jgi:cobalt-zinc-cadmium efflux system membrane fusion protein
MQQPAMLLLASMLLCAACGASPEQPESRTTETAGGQGGERVNLPAEALRTTPISTAPVEQRELTDEIRATAVIKPNENRLAHVSPPIPGRAIAVQAVLGDRVEPGQVLALLDSLELGEKKSAFLQARTNLEVARRNYEREAGLFKQRISSEKDYLESKGEFERSEAAYRAAREALRLVGIADADIERISWGGTGSALSQFPIRSPFRGTVIEQHVVVGELVRPEEKVYAIADLETLWILLDIYEKDLAQVAIGKDVEVRVDAYPDARFHGKIAYLSDVLDESTRTARARVEVDNSDGRLRPGMFATAIVTLPGSTARPVVVVPEAAVQRVRGQPTAFVEEQPGSYLVRSLTLGRQTGDLVEVQAGLQPGERVVTDGGFTLKSLLLKDELAGDE